MYIAEADPLDFAKKLEVKPGRRLALVKGPDAFRHAVSQGLPIGAELSDSLDTAGSLDVVVLWPKGMADLEQLIEAARPRLKPDGAIWVVIPRKPVARRSGSDLKFDHVQAQILATGLVDNKTLTFSEEEYGIRFVIRVTERISSS